MTIAKRLDALQQKHPALGFPIAVLYKFLDDQGVYLAALIAYYASSRSFLFFCCSRPFSASCCRATLSFSNRSWTPRCISFR